MSLMIVSPDGWPTLVVSSPAASVPDGASTALLFSAALSGVVLLRRKLATNSIK